MRMKLLTTLFSVLLFSSISFGQIVNQPTDQSVCGGSNTQFSFTHTFSSPTFQWQIWDGNSFVNITNSAIYSGVTTDELSVSGATVSGTFQCEIIDNAVSHFTDPVDLIILASTGITSNPSNQTACIGSSASFTVSASGFNPSYQWQWNSGSGWTDISSGGSSPAYSNYTTATLTLTGVSSSIANYQYRCVVTGCGIVNSSPASLTVQTLPTITVQATTSIVCLGSSTSFTISATGTSINYQWQVNSSGTWADISSAGSGPSYSGFNSPSLSLTGVQTSNNGNQYRCIVSGTCSPDAISNAVQLTVLTPPSIVSSPGNQTVCPGQQATFAVSAQGSSLGYQWQVNTSGSWVNINSAGSSPSYSGFTSATLNVNTISTQHTGTKYRCIVSGACNPTTQSAEATLTVNVPPYFSAMPQNATLCEDGNTQFSIQGAGTNIVYQWQIKSGSTWTNISAAGSSPQYSGWNTASLGLSNVPLSYNGDSVRCIVSGTCSPNAVSNSAALRVNKKPVIISQPINLLGCEGGTTTFSLIADGTGLNYQWQVNTGTGWTTINGGNSPNYSGWNSANLQLSSLLSWNNGYYYRCLVSGTCSPSVMSDSALLEVHARPYINSSLIDQSVCEQEASSWSINSSGNNLSYTWQIDTGSGWAALASTPYAADFNGIGTYQLSLSKSTPSFNGVDFRVLVGNQGCGLKSSNTSRLTVNTKPSISLGADRYICAGQSTQLDLTSPNSALNRFNWTPSIGLSNPFIQAPTASPAAITTYILAAWDTNGCYQMDTIQLDVKAKPKANAGLDQELCAGTNFTLSGSGGLSYEWLNAAGNQIGPGSVLFLEAKNTEEYKLRVTDQYACADSDYVHIKVNPLPLTNASKDQAACYGSQVQLSATGAATYQWLTSGLSDSLVYNPNLIATNSKSIILKGWSDKGCLQSDTMSLTVFSLPQLQTSPDTQICANSEAHLLVSGASSYRWFPSGNLNSPTTNTPVFTGTADELLFVEGIDGNGCRSVDSVKVVVNALPQVDAGANESICAGSSVLLNASGANTYTWTPAGLLDDPSSATPEATPTVTSNFVVQGTDGKGCINYDTVNVKVISNPTPSIQGETAVCNGQVWTSYEANAAGGDLTWSVQGGTIQSGYGSERIYIAWDSNLSVGEVRLTETSLEQCEGTSVLAINSNGKSASKPVDVIAKANDIRTGILISRNPDLDTYYWGKESKNGSSLQTLDSGNYWSDYAYIDTFNYRYWLIAGNQGECLTKNYFGGYPLLSVRNALQSTVNVYPNPNTGQFKLSLSFTPTQINLRNGIGALVTCPINEVEPGVWNVDGAALSPGIYYIQTQSTEGVQRIDKVVITQ